MRKTLFQIFSLATLLLVASMSLSFSAPIVETNGEDEGKKNDNDSTSTEVIESATQYYDTTGLFSEHWYNDRTFAFMEERKTSFNDSTVIQLCDDVHDYSYPVINKINSPFGYRRGVFHKGLDIDLERGDTVVAAFDGIVRYAKYNHGGFGNLVIIRHHNGLETYYAHLNKLHVKPNDTIQAGELLGLGGNSGARHSGCHLHFEVRVEDKPIDPAQIFDTETFNLKTTELQLESDIFAPSHHSKSYSKNAKTYYVRSGDCLSIIARRHGTTVSNLCNLNGLRPTSVLQIGQKLRIR